MQITKTVILELKGEDIEALKELLQRGKADIERQPFAPCGDAGQRQQELTIFAKEILSKL